MRHGGNANGPKQSNWWNGSGQQLVSQQMVPPSALFDRPKESEELDNTRDQDDLYSPNTIEFGSIRP